MPGAARIGPADPLAIKGELRHDGREEVANG
jgi:hypothetical protein